MDNLSNRHEEVLLIDKFYNCDIKGEENLEKVFKENNVNKIAFYSTASTYGKHKNIPILE